MNDEMIEELIIEKLRCYAVTNVAPSFLRDLEVKIEHKVDFVGSGLWDAIRLRALIPGSKDVRVLREIEYPASLWDCVKKYLGINYKVEVCPVEVTIIHTCPHLEMPPNRSDTIHWFKSVAYRPVEDDDVNQTIGVRRDPR
jgi:hypothetical protein